MESFSLPVDVPIMGTSTFTYYGEYMASHLLLLLFYVHVMYPYLICCSHRQMEASKSGWREGSRRLAWWFDDDGRAKLACGRMISVTYEGKG